MGALAVAGRWRAEPSWVDRLGRALGVFWVLLIGLEFQVWAWTYALFDLIAGGVAG